MHYKVKIEDKEYYPFYSYVEAMDFLKGQSLNQTTWEKIKSLFQRLKSTIRKTLPKQPTETLTKRRTSL